jgi:hypothetical protein
MLLALETTGVYCLLVAVFAAGALLFVLLSWSDTRRAVGEFFSPLRLVPLVPRFRTWHLLVGVGIVSLAVRLALKWGWRESPWLVLVAAGISIILSAVVSLLWFCYRDMFGRRPASRSDVKIDPPNTAEQSESASVKPSRVRFAKKRRQTSAFKW